MGLRDFWNPWKKGKKTSSKGFSNGKQQRKVERKFISGRINKWKKGPPWQGNDDDKRR
jgi:hypothetical protein